jgi:hypothetical protein
MPYTTNEGIQYPSSSSDLVPLEGVFAVLAASVDEAIGRRSNPNVTDAGAQLALYGDNPRHGVGVYREDLGLELRYNDGRAKSKPFPGWFAQSGTLLQVHNVPWEIKNNDNGDFAFGDKPQVLVSGSIPDPGVPFRMKMSVRCEFGTTAAGTRWDLSMGAGGTNQIAQQIDFATRVDEVVAPISVTSLVSPQVFTGTTRVAVVANHVYGPALGVLKAPNRQWKIEVVAA